MKTLTRPDITHFLKIGATYVVHCICANVHEWKMRGRAGIGINCWVVARCIVADFRLQTEASEVRSQSSQSFVVRLVAWGALSSSFSFDFGKSKIGMGWGGGSSWWGLKSEILTRTLTLFSLTRSQVEEILFISSRQEQVQSCSCDVPTDIEEDH